MVRPLMSLLLPVVLSWPAFASARAEPATLASLLDSPGDLVVVTGRVVVPENLKVEPRKTLRVEPGGTVEIAEGAELEIAGRLEAGAYRIFEGDGAVTGAARIERVHPEWFFEGAYDDEGVDWSGAINKALAFAAENCRAVFLGPHVYNVNRTVDMSSQPAPDLMRPGMRLEGALRNSQYNKGTTILGNTGPGGAILETTDSDGLHVINIALRAGTKTPSTIGLLQARGTGTGWGGDHVYDNLFVSMGSDPKANAGAGTIGVCNVAAEETRYENLQVWANLPLIFSWSHTFSLTNPELDGTVRSVTVESSVGLPLAHQASPTYFAITGMGRLIALDAVSPVVLLAVTASVDLGNTFMQRRPGSPDAKMAGTYDYAVENWNCYQFRHFGSAEGIATYLLSRRDLTEADIHLRLAPVEDASKPAIQLFDDGGNYQLRNVRLVLDALGVDRPLIRFDKFPRNSNGGFKIVNPDFHSNLSRLQGIRIDQPGNP